jgi:ABC-type cobalamin/Fe3+-siderophores transport system ATPase subunit
LTAPDFSYKKDKEIMKLIKIIQKKTQKRSETVMFDEKEALRLVLEKYVSLEQLKDDLNDYDPKLIDYYGKNEVSFSRGNKIDFSSNKENIYKDISARVYQTRNSIVHSKEGDKPKYIPYQHEKQLLHEISLIKIISEEIIIQSSEVLFDSE